MKYCSESIKLASEMPVVNVRPGLSRQVMGYDDNIMLVRVKFDEEMVGQRPPLHQHPHVQSSYVVSGKFEAHIGDEVKILSAGDAYYVPSNLPHELYCLEPGVLIDGFSPIREDFL
jgi:quercetin dioxygenase-like cupin family protein